MSGTMRCWIKALLATAGLAAAVAPAGRAAGDPGHAGAPASEVRAGVAVGVNLEGVKDWSRLSPFVDLMKSARAWGLPGQPWVHGGRTDALGWPLQDAGVVVKMLEQDAGDPQAGRGNLDPGVYRLSFRGRAARVRPVSSPGVSVRNLAHDATTGLSTAEVVVGGNASQLMLGFEGTDGGVRDVRLVPASAAAGQTFSPAFRAAIAPFGTLRLMDFLETNGNPTRRWSERTTPQAATRPANAAPRTSTRSRWPMNWARTSGSTSLQAWTMLTCAPWRFCSTGRWRPAGWSTWSTATSCGTRSFPRPRGTGRRPSPRHWPATRA
jgi:hypothetical protein